MTKRPGGYRGLSLWLDSLAAAGEDDLAPRPALPGDRDADVAVIGAGYTGLWTARTLLAADPTLRVVVLEAEIAGFGASGRNGGWCSALFPASAAALARRHGRPAALAMRRAMNATVGEVGRAAAEEGLDVHWRAGGTVVLARTPVQLARASAAVAEDGAFDGVDGLELLDAGAARERVGAEGVLGATFTPHCARLHPARLARGLARVVERRGAVVHERTRALAVAPAARAPPRRAHRARHGHRRRGGPGHRGLDGDPPGLSPRGGSRVLPDGRDGAPARRLLGRRGAG